MRGIRALRFGIIGAILTGTALLSGCSQINKTGANIALRFTEKNLIPPLFKIDDLEMACLAGETLTPLLKGVEGMKADANQILTIQYAAAGICSEQRAIEYELRYLRSSRANLIDDAQDARVMQKRQAEIAARRQLAGWNHFVAHYEGKRKAPIGDKCPKFKNDFDEIVYMFGLIEGVQAIVNDIAAQQAVGVPKDIGAKVERAMQCLDNNKWWGAPMATRAAIWNLLPGAGEGKGDPWETIKQSMRIGERTGVRLPHAMYAMSAQAKGDEELIRDSIRAYAATENTALNPNYRMIDRMGFMIVQNISDRYWTEKTGSRTPPGSLGKFWDDKPAVEDSGIDLDDLL